MEKLEWNGKDDYNKAEWRGWYVDGEEQGKAAGVTKKAGGLTFASLYGAGHMISVSLSLSQRPLLRYIGLIRVFLARPSR